MQAVVMAGGFGTRLRPLTCMIPKPMVPMANRPMLEHVLKLLKRHGFDELHVMLLYQPEIIQNYFRDGDALGVHLRYWRLDQDLGTAGCVKFIERELHEPFLVISGDLLTDFDLRTVWEFHRQQGALATMVLTRVSNPLPYGVVIVDAEGRVTRFLEKPSWGEVFSDTVNTGIYLLDPAVLPYIPAGRPFDFSKQLFPLLLQEGVGLYGAVVQGYWRDVGTLGEYRAAHADLLEGKITLHLPGRRITQESGELVVDEDSQIAEDVYCEGRVLIGRRCRIASGVRLARSIIGDGVEIGAGADLDASVVWADTAIGEEARLKEAIVGCRVRLADDAELQEGSVVADECVVGTGAVVRSQVKMWPHKRLEDGAALTTSLIWGEQWGRSLFSAYGITGLCNIEITPEFAARLGTAYGAYLGPQAYVLTSRDAHPASRMIKRALISGLLSAGVKVGDLRTAPVPVVRYELGKEGERGALHVRLSPFDQRVVDIQCFDHTGAALSAQQEQAIEQLFQREDFPRAQPGQVGELITPPRALEYYRAGFLKAIDGAAIREANLKIIIDYAVSSAALIFPSLLGELGVEIISLNAYLNPAKVSKTTHEFQEALKQLAHIVLTVKADMGFLIDTGAEKVFLVDNRGKVIPNDLALLVVLELAMQQGRPGRVGVPVTVSRVLEEMAATHGIGVQRLRTTPRHIVAASREPGMLCVGDGVGGFIFPEFQPAFDAMYAIAKILEMVARQQVQLHQRARAVTSYATLHQRIPCAWDKKGKVMRMALEDAQGKQVELIDGVKVFRDDSWVLLLPDPDEAYFHVWVESQHPRAGRSLLKTYTEKIQQWQG
ncbi:MAG: mannose-1-phosphate guanyltransferase [Elusimicrobia bacterium]|nr:mannose-1-phosphate guanyltransferase [Elusimicrobiota bacterium]